MHRCCYVDRIMSPEAKAALEHPKDVLRREDASDGARNVPCEQRASFRVVYPRGSWTDMCGDHVGLVRAKGDRLERLQ